MKMEVSDLRHYHILLLLTHMRTTSFTLYRFYVLGTSLCVLWI